MPKSFQPYNDQKYNRVFNLPPNEVAFMGGLGGKRGNARSILHTERPTEVQKIFNMRTGNRGIFTMTENPLNTQNLVKKRAPITNMNKQVRAIVDKVWMANNFEEKAKSSESDSIYMTRRVPRVIPPPEPLPTTHLINQVRDRLDKMFKIPDELLQPRETFTEWAIKEREKYKQRRAAKAVKRERTITEILSMDHTSESETESFSASERSRRRTTKRRDVIQHIAGYMYGEFTKIPRPGKKATKFGIPLSMLERAKDEAEKQKEKDRKLRRARIAHMKLPMYFEDENSEEDDVVETVKALTLIRTPFLRLPKIKTQRKRRRDRLRTKYLKQDRLKRITMLLYDRSYDGTSKESLEKSEKSLESLESSQAVTKTNDAKTMSIEKKKYINFIKETYTQQVKGYEEEKVEEEEATSFEHFKETEDWDVIRTKSSTPLGGVESVKQEEQLPVYKPKKNEKFSKSDERIGPYYIDPEQMEKMNDPTRCEFVFF